MKTALTAALAATVLATASSASAALWDITYTGIVHPETIDGIPIPIFPDGGGLFGPAGGTFVEGEAVSVTFVVDDAKGALVTPATFPGASYFGFGAENPALSAAVTIGGATYTFSPYSATYTISPPGVSGPYVRTVANDSAGVVGLLMEGVAADGIPDHLTNFSAAMSGDGQFFDEHTLTNNTTEVPFEADHIDITRVGGAVPEPATWALMISGFGVAGAALRRRATTTRFA